jgi:hypothetical protein
VHHRITGMRTKETIDDNVFQAGPAQTSGKKLGEVLSELARRSLPTSGESTSTKSLLVFKVPGDPLGQHHSPPCHVYNHPVTGIQAEKWQVKNGDNFRLACFIFYLPFFCHVPSSIWRKPCESAVRQQAKGKATPAKRLAKWRVELRPVDKSVRPIAGRSQNHAAPSTG